MRVVVGLLVAAFLIAACGGAGSDRAACAASDGGLGCAVGTGFEGFQPLMDGSTVNLVKGPQGGEAYHVWIAVRVAAHPDGPIAAHVTGRLAQGGTLIGNPLDFNLLPSECTHEGVERSGIRYQLSVDPSLVRGQSVVLHFDARLPGGTACSDEHTVLVD